MVPHEGDLARTGDRRERSDLGGRRGYRYFPRETVRKGLLLAAPKTQSDLVCPNGVQFYDVTDGAARQPPVLSCHSPPYVRDAFWGRDEHGSTDFPALEFAAA